jgi:YVTN family beta-propeller protein
VIDGATNSATTVTDPSAIQPQAVAVNPVTNKIYVGNSVSNNVTVIDGATNSTTTVTDPNASFPIAVAVNSVTNKIYVKNVNFTVTVIDGLTNSTVTLSTPTSSDSALSPNLVAVNAVTDRIYVVNYGTNNVTVIAGGTPFSSFRGKLELDLDAGSFDLNASFALGAGMGINPPNQPVSLTIGTYSVTIPAGSFVKHKPGYAFEGIINGVSLEVLIKFGSTPGSYRFLAKGKGANLKGTTGPVTVTLSIGNNIGTTQINAGSE